MRTLVVMAMFTSSLTYGAWNGYTGTRDLELSTSGVDILEIDDGSVSVRISNVTGTVTIDDGSGNIDVRDVEQDLEIVDDGSGSVRIAAVRGAVHRDD